MAHLVPPKPVAKKKKRKSIDWSGHILSDGRYEVGGSVGSGSFADVFEARITETRRRVCMKFEERAKANVEAEYRVLQRLASSGVTPKPFDFLRTSKVNVLVFELLGPSLDALLKKSEQRMFSLNTTALVAANCLECIKQVHAAGFLHRDIKPHNFVIGNQGGRNRLYIIDFGLSKAYLTEGRQHVPFSKNKSFIGTARYVSVNTHRGYEQGRRDDLESIAYILIYFAKGGLPWQGVGAKLEKRERLQLISDQKQAATALSLCSGLPQAFSRMLAYAKGLNFTSLPDYDALKAMFAELYDPSVPLDWEASGLADSLTEELASRSAEGFQRCQDGGSKPWIIEA